MADAISDKAKKEGLAMKWRSLISGFAILLVSAASATAQKPDFGGYKDHPLFTRMPNFSLGQKSSLVEKQFDGHDFMVTQGKGTAKQRVEGRYLFYN